MTKQRNIEQAAFQCAAAEDAVRDAIARLRADAPKECTRDLEKLAEQLGRHGRSIFAFSKELRIDSDGQQETKFHGKPVEAAL